VNPIRARNKQTGAVGHFCEKVSPGCAHCYAETWNSRVRPIATKNGGHLIGTGLAYDVRNREQIKFFLDDSKLLEVLKRRQPTKWFWCDMTDPFGEWVPDAWIDRCFAVMALTPQHTHQVLTKRAERMRNYVSGARPRIADVIGGQQLATRFDDEHCSDVANRILGQAIAGKDRPGLPVWPLQNVWLGVSVENRDALKRIDALKDTPAAVRFVSFEPLLEDLGALILDGIHWGIFGGESGRGARPCDLAWIRSGVRECRRQGVACFVKQVGARPMFGGTPVGYYEGSDYKHPKGGDPAEWPSDICVREFPR
jgi:protein gp37